MTPRRFRSQADLLQRSKDCALRDSSLRCRRTSASTQIEGERSDCLRNAGAKWGDNGNRGPARELLAPVYEAFTEGFDTHALA